MENVFQTRHLLILIVGMLLLSFIFNSIMSKFLKVEKRKILSYDYVNKTHMKIDWVLRIVLVIILIIYLFYTFNDPYKDDFFWRTLPLKVSLLSIAIPELTRAFMEWKYAENRKAYVLTISQLIFDLILIGIILIIFYFFVFK
ncbi:hypothetical protein BW727_101228 [Jeotgalibaca dankookensis]|uniref:DUF4181 domain-containing protein n=1 Tax=Jeotgalibaca dankookensis TaxID=708126 RepID=A0A1S6IPW8_9LACT|nr:DUF4181 domain-containing protein [Jeotgalibaca dankookensis]AQS53595.1 hypothetical protein BW727_101228 [Jeotgalibaca dankookensis]